MTPKEKAQDLYQMYYECLWHQDEQSRIQNAKQCALIAVDEMLSFEKSSIDLINAISKVANLGFERKGYYYEEVKQEIEKL